MKKLLTISFLLFSFAAFSQFPAFKNISGRWKYPDGLDVPHDTLHGKCGFAILPNGIVCVGNCTRWFVSAQYVATNPQPNDNIILGSDGTTFVNSPSTSQIGLDNVVTFVHLSGLDYLISESFYHIANIHYHFPAGIVTLPIGTATAGQFRKDLLTLTAAGPGSITGDNSIAGIGNTKAYDLNATIVLGTVTINSTDAVPSSPSTNRDVYQEHAGQPTETTVTPTSVTLNADDVSNPAVGVKDINVTVFPNTGSIDYTFNVLQNKSLYDNIVIQIDLITALPVGSDLAVSLGNAGSFSNAVPMSARGLITVTTGSYQYVVIPLNLFTGSSSFDQIRWTRIGSGAVHFLIDNYYLQNSGIATASQLTLYNGDGHLLGDRVIHSDLHSVTYDSLQSFNAKSIDLAVSSLGGLPPAGSQFTRTTYFAPGTHLNVKFTFGNQSTWNIGANDSTNLNPQNRDGIAGLKDEIAFGKNPAYTGRSVIMSGTGAGDAIAALHAQVGIYSSSGNRFYFRNALGGATAYLFSGDGSIEDTVETWYGFTSGTGGTLTPKVLKWYDFYGGIGSPHADSIWGLYIQSGVVGAGTIARNFIQGPLALGGYHTGPTNQLEVYGSVQIKDGTESNGYVFTSNGTGVGHWAPGSAGAGALLAVNNLSDVSNITFARSNIGAAHIYKEIGTAAASANYAITTSNYIILADLTGQANRTVTLPVSPASGQQVAIRNLDNSAFNWSFGGGTVKDNAGNTVTTLSDLTPYFLTFDGTVWYIDN